jgi:hypothetical protein
MNITTLLNQQLCRMPQAHGKARNTLGNRLSSVTFGKEYTIKKYWQRALCRVSKNTL